MCITMCGHLFCFECINSLLINNNNAKCPECRRLLNKKFYYFNNSNDNNYSSRVRYLINFLQQNNKKRFLLVVHNDSTVKTVNEILIKNNILCSNTKGNFINTKSELDKINVFTVSYSKIESILGMYNFSDIIILHPSYDDDHFKTENNLFLRLNTSNILDLNIYRFILKILMKKLQKFKLISYNFLI